MEKSLGKGIHGWNKDIYKIIINWQLVINITDSLAFIPYVCIQLMHVGLLSVHSVNISIVPPELPIAEHSRASFICSVGSSNPRSHVRWELDDTDVTDDATEVHLPGGYNADHVMSVLEVTVERTMNEHNLSCDIIYGNTFVAQQTLSLDVACELSCSRTHPQHQPTSYLATTTANKTPTQ